MVKTGFCHVVKLLLTTWYFGLHTSGTNKNIILISQGSSGRSLIMCGSRRTRAPPVLTGIILHAYAIRMNLVEYCCDGVWGGGGWFSVPGVLNGKDIEAVGGDGVAGGVPLGDVHTLPHHWTPGLNTKRNTSVVITLQGKWIQVDAQKIRHSN